MVVIPPDEASVVIPETFKVPEMSAKELMSTFPVKVETPALIVVAVSPAPVPVLHPE